MWEQLWPRFKHFSEEYVRCLSMCRSVCTSLLMYVCILCVHICVNTCIISDIYISFFFFLKLQMGLFSVILDFIILLYMERTFLIPGSAVFLSSARELPRLPVLIWSKLCVKLIPSLQFWLFGILSFFGEVLKADGLWVSKPASTGSKHFKQY